MLRRFPGQPGQVGAGNVQRLQPFRQPRGGLQTVDPVDQHVHIAFSFGIVQACRSHQLSVETAHRRAVEADHVGQHQPDRHSVGNPVIGGQGIGAGMGGAEHGIFDRQPGQMRSQQHLAPGGGILALLQDRLEICFQEMPGFPGKHLRHGIAPGGNETFQGMGDGIDAGHRGYFIGHTLGQQRIEDHNAEARLDIAAGHLAVGFLLRDQGVRLSFAAGAGGGGHPDGGQHRLYRLAAAPVILHPAAVGQQKINPLGAIHGAASPQPDNAVNAAEILRKLTAGLHVAGGGIFYHIMEYLGLHPGCFQGPQRPGHMPGADNPGIGDQQHPLRRQRAGQLSQPLQGVLSEDHPGGRLKIK